MFIGLILPSCISVKLKTGTESQQSKSIELIVPLPPFNESKQPMGDRSWSSQKTGNIISYMSSCSDEDPDLKNLEKEILTSLEQGEIVDSQSVEINYRSGLASHFKGKIDGVPVFIETVIFKKNHCSYILNFSGPLKFKGRESEYFSNFTNSFRVP